MIGPRFNIDTEPFWGLSVESIEFDRVINGKVYSFTRDVWAREVVVCVYDDQYKLIHRFEWAR